MFTIQCTTCGANLAVKNEKLLGQILACPQCGGMVLVEKPVASESKSDLPLAANTVNAPTPSSTEHEPLEFSVTTESPASEGTSESEVIPPPFPAEQSAAQPTEGKPQVELAQSELRTRKILLSILVSLIALLVFALGIVLSRKTSEKTTTLAVDPTHESSPPSAPIETPTPPNRTVSSEDAQTPPKSQDHLSPNPSQEKLATLLATASPSPPTIALQTQNTPKAITEKVPSNTPDETAAETLEGPDVDHTTAPIHDTEDSKPENSSTVEMVADLERDIEKRGSTPADIFDTKTIDAAARLEMTIPSFKVNGATLRDFIRTISAVTEVPFSFRIDDFRVQEIHLNQTLEGVYENKTLRQILDEQLAPLNLEAMVGKDDVLVAVRKDLREEMREERFSVSDIISGTKNAVDLHGRPDPNGSLTAERLADLLRRLVDPSSAGQLRAAQQTAETQELPGFFADEQSDEPAIIVRHCPRQRDLSLRLLEQIRVMRNLPQRTDITGAALVPEVFGWDRMTSPTTLNYYQPTALSVILPPLEALTGMTILVDHRELHQALAPFSSLKTTVQGNHEPIDDILNQLLANVEILPLTYRIIDSETLEITTFEAASQPEEMTVEVHFFETAEFPLQDDESPEEWAETLKLAIAPESWYRADKPETRGGGDIVIDRPSGCALIRQSQPVQRAIRVWLLHKNNPTASSEVPTPAESER